MKRIVLVLLLTGCSASIDFAKPNSGVSKAEVSEAFKSRDEALRTLSIAIKDLQTKITPPKK